MIAVVLADLGLLTAFTGVVSLVRPLAFLGIHNRVRAAAVIAAGLLIVLVALLLPARAITVPSATSALDRVTPTYQFHEIHSVTVRGTPERTYEAIRQVTADEILFLRTLIRIRQLGQPLPESVRTAPADRPLLDIATATNFVTLADTPNEILVGTVVHAPPGVRRWPVTADEFLALRSRPGFALATMNFAIARAGADACVVSTETRVFATDASARRRFAAYWRMIYPGSALIRRMWLRAIRLRVEGDRP